MTTDIIPSNVSIDIKNSAGDTLIMQKNNAFAQLPDEIIQQ